MPLPHQTPKPRVAILMGVCNGKRFLTAQLDSLAAQTHTKWDLLISDDSPDNASARVISDWRKRHPDRQVKLVKGLQRGFAANFMSLLAQAPQDADFIALCDQDDVWFPDKLTRALDRLQKLDETPALYCAATIVADETLRPLRPSSPFPKAPSFRNALIQSIGGGNTMVLNRKAAHLVQHYAAISSEPVAHDWWLYQLLTGLGGRIIRDDEPVLFYRQHEGNQIGANNSAAARLSRIGALLQGQFRDWAEHSLASLAAAEPDFTPDAQRTIALYRSARHGPVRARLNALYQSGVVRQSKLGTVALYIACLLKRI